MGRPGPPPGRPMPPPGAVMGAPTPLSAPLPPAEDPANWTEYTAQDGRKYYHNKVSFASLIHLSTYFILSIYLPICLPLVLIYTMMVLCFISL